MFHSEYKYTPISVYNQALFSVYYKKHKNVLIRPMDELADIRRKLLASLVTDQFSLADVGRMFGKPDRQIKDMIAERKSFGAKVARSMENYAISQGFINIWPYYFDGIKRENEKKFPTKDDTIIAGVKIDSYEEQLLKVFSKLNDGYKDTIMLLANDLYDKQYPNDPKSNPNSHKRKKAK